ncbi:hypothetical protein MMPV_004429 [Pyropia vietnamensis]
MSATNATGVGAAAAAAEPTPGRSAARGLLRRATGRRARAAAAAAAAAAEAAAAAAAADGSAAAVAAAAGGGGSVPVGVSTGVAAGGADGFRGLVDGSGGVGGGGGGGLNGGGGGRLGGAWVAPGAAAAAGRPALWAGDAGSGGSGRGAPVVARLTIRLIETYERINSAYYATVMGGGGGTGVVAPGGGAALPLTAWEADAGADRHRRAGRPDSVEGDGDGSGGGGVGGGGGGGSGGFKGAYSWTGGVPTSLARGGSFSRVGGGGFGGGVGTLTTAASSSSVASSVGSVASSSRGGGGAAETGVVVGLGVWLGGSFHRRRARSRTGGGGGGGGGGGAGGGGIGLSGSGSGLVGRMSSVSSAATATPEPGVLGSHAVRAGRRQLTRHASHERGWGKRGSSLDGRGGGGRSGSAAASYAGSAGRGGATFVSTPGSGTGGIGRLRTGSGDTVSPAPVCDANRDYVVRPGAMLHRRYLLERVIGRGSFGQVVKALDTHTGEHVAVKIVKADPAYLAQAAGEARLTAFLNRRDPTDAHAVLRLRARFVERGHQCLVLELLSVSLYDLLRSTDFAGVKLRLARKFGAQILTCLSFLSHPDVGVVHADLKPENVLLRHAQRSAIKVVDFGSASRLADATYAYVQSRFYRAPEVILGLPYGHPVDVWSLGCMLVELHTGYPLFPGADEADQMSIIVSRLGLPPAAMLDAAPKTAQFFIRDEVTGAYTLRPPPAALVGKRAVHPPPGVAGGGPSSLAAHFIAQLTASRRAAATASLTAAAAASVEREYAAFEAAVSRMLVYDPAVRISATEALRDKFFAAVLPSASRSTPRVGPTPPPPSSGANKLAGGGEAAWAA